MRWSTQSIKRSKTVRGKTGCASTMSKRSNVNGQMSREDYEAQDDDSGDEGQGMGTFKRASADVLATRKIIKVKRPGSTSTGEQPTATSSATPIVPFVGFGATTNHTATNKPAITVPSTTRPAVAEKTSDGDDGSERAKKIRKLNESFLKWAKAQLSENPLSIWKEGVRDYIAHAQAIEQTYGDSKAKASTTEASTKAAAPAPAVNPLSSFSFGAKPAAPAPASAPVAAPAATPFAGFSFGAKPADTSAAAAAPAPAPATAPLAGFSFGGAKPDAAAAPAPAANPLASFSFGAKPSAPATSAPAPPPAATTPFAGFSFGGASSTAAPAAPGAAVSEAPKPFAFNAPTTAATPAPAAPFGSSSAGGFGSTAFPSFGGFGSSAAPATSASAGAGAGGEDEEGGDEEGEPILEPEKVLRNAADTDEIVHDVPCKLFSFNVTDKEWKDVGKGTFRITRDPATKKQRMLVRNQMGRINFNAGFYATMKVEKVQKRLKFAAVVAVEDTSLNSDGKTSTRTELKNFMIQLKPEDLDATQRKMEEAIKAVA